VDALDAHCRVPEIVKTVPHRAFAVENLDAALEGKQILIPLNSPSPGVRVAFILDDGVPIELLEFDGPVSRYFPFSAPGRRSRTRIEKSTLFLWTQCTVRYEQLMTCP
jgi:hypothetical protein